MNKSLFSLALVSFAFLAISACSEDKEKGHSDFCKNGPSKDCLVGNWRLNSDLMSNCGESGNLKFKADGEFEFQGTIAGLNPNEDRVGKWTLEGDIISIVVTVGNFPESTTGTVIIPDGGQTMTVESTSAPSTFVLCNPEKKKYSFTWIGE